MIATAAGCLIGSVLLAAPASAHAILVSSSPADGARVDAAPASVTLTFDEAVQPVRADDEVISSTTGERVDTGSLQQSADGTTLVLPLRPGLPRGSYTAVWRVVSADTHVMSGSITFGVGVDPAAAPVAVDEQRTGALDVGADVAQGLVYAGMVLLLGVAAATTLWWPRALALRRLRVTVRVGWLLAVIATAGQLLLQGPRAANQGWGAVWRFVGLDQTFGEAYGWELAMRLALLLLVTPLLTRRALTGLRGRRTVLGVVAGVALLLTVALAGHESVGTDVPLAMTAAMVHLLAMTVWLGGVTALAVVVLPASGGAGQVSADSMPRWSLTAYVCVVLLVVSGEYQASRQLEPVQALWSTSYGLVLLTKIGLVAIVLAAGAFAHRRVHTCTPDGFLHDGVTAAIRHNVRLESATAVLVVAATAVLVSLPPGNTTYGPTRHPHRTTGARHRAHLRRPHPPRPAGVRVRSPRPRRQAGTGPDDHCLAVERDRRLAGTEAPTRHGRRRRIGGMAQRRDLSTRRRDLDHRPRRRNRPDRRLRHHRAVPSLVTPAPQVSSDPPIPHEETTAPPTGSPRSSP